MPGGEGAVNFSVQILTAEGFRALTGADPDRLTEGRYVSGASLQPGASVTGAPERTWLDPAATATLVPSLTTPLPHVIPRNATGVMWTQVGHGHFSQFASVEGSLTARGFRGSLVRQGWGMLFPQTLQTGIPGGFRNDFLFTFSPGQTVVYRPVDPTAAESFRSRLNVTEFPETYRLPPRPGLAAACQGANCITVPAEVIKEALGGRPEILTPEGPVDITKMGRPTEGAPFESSQAGRGATVREYLGQPDEYFTERGLTRTRVPAYTPYARTGVGFVKAGGVIFMVYGAYRTYERLEAAAGTPEFPAVVTEEAGSWTGGILGSAFGAAAGAAIACSPTGPVTLVCVAGGFIGGLIFGYLGGAAGAEVGRGLYAGGGGECPSCHAEQRKWEQERRFKNIPEFGRSSLLPRGSLGSGQLTEEESRLIREWLAAPRPTQ